MEDESCDSLSDIVVDERVPLKIKKSLPRKNRHYVPGVVSHEASVDFDEIANALEVLKSPDESYKQKSICKSKYNDNFHKYIIHHTALIKHAMFKGNWRPISRLLSEYIGSAKKEKDHKKIIHQYFMMYLLNDQVAIKNKSLRKFLHSGLLCHSENEMKLILKRLMTLDRVDESD